MTERLKTWLQLLVERHRLNTHNHVVVVNRKIGMVKRMRPDEFVQWTCEQNGSIHDEEVQEWIRERRAKWTLEEGKRVAAREKAFFDGIGRTIETIEKAPKQPLTTFRGIRERLTVWKHLRALRRLQQRRMPSLWSMAKRLGWTGIKVLWYRYVWKVPIKARETLKGNRLTICRGDPKGNVTPCGYHDKGRCLLCGCYVEKKAALSADKCPAGKW